MIGQLPTVLMVGSKELQIRTDYRVALTIFQAFNDPELNLYEKNIVMLECLYIEPINEKYINEALEKARWFLDCGDDYEAKEHKKIMDWEQDEQMIFSAVNKVAGCETRSKEYIHWWSFMAYFTEIGEGLFSTVISIRKKKNKGKKLEKYEQEFYRENQKLIDIKPRLTQEEQEEVDRWNQLLG